MAHHLAASGGCPGLRILGVSGQSIDDAGIEVRAFGGNEQRTRVIAEIIRHDDAMELIREDQVGADAHEVAGEEKVSVRDRNHSGWRFRQPVALELKGLVPQAVRQKPVGVVQDATVKKLKIN
ncbi:hypothetical protein [Bradyrhizobium sp. USDA 377]